MIRTATTPLALIACLAAAPVALAQPRSPADSATAARTAWREAATALRKGDDDTAWQQALLASRLWPEQPAYLRGVAIAAARRTDPTALIDALDRLAAFQVNPGLAQDSAVAALRERPAVARALARLDAATAPLRRSTVAATLPDTTAFIEGITIDPGTGTIYLASVRHRTIYAVRPDGAVRDLGIARHRRIGAILGVRFDAGALWATTAGLPQSQGYTPADSSIAALLRIRPADGALLRRWDLPEGIPHVAGDLAIGPGGDVFVTDSRSPWLYQLARGADTLVARTDPLFRSLQGPAPAPDGRIVYLADYSHGILRYDLETGTAARLAAPAGVTTLGIDGLVLHGRSLIGIQNGVEPARVVRLVLDPAGQRIVAATTLDRRLPDADQPTIGTLAGADVLYVGNSQWEQYDDDGRRTAKPLRPTLILRLKLP